VSETLRADRGRGERGSSLVEVTLALGLMACVLASIAGLFVMGAGGVRSGRCTSAALAGARTIMEEIQGWNVQQVYQEFGLDGTASSYVVDTRDAGFANKWQPPLDAKLAEAYATIVIASLEPGAPPLENSWQVRVLVTVHWVEGTRSRSVQLGAVMM
jgi:type II secretory pathway pseudopilin PulG